MDGCYAALDLGTTHIKVLVFNRRLEISAEMKIQHRPELETPRGLCFDADSLWEKVRKALQAVCPEKIVSLGVTGMADSGLLVDASGKPLTEVIPWGNPAGEHNRETILRKFPLAELYEITGQTLHPKFALSRLLLYRGAEPEVFDKAACWLSIQDYIVMRLTGRRVTDRTLACRTMLYDLTENRWSDELCAFAGIDGRLPAVIETGAKAGEVTADAAKQTGLPVGTPVLCCGHDHVCGLFAAQLLCGAAVLSSLGTGEVFTGLTDASLPVEFAGMGVNCGIYSGSHTYWMANLPSSGACLEWLRGIASTGGALEYSFFDSNPIADPGDVVFIPHLNGSGVPEPDSSRRGAFLGLSSNVTIHQLACAVNRGIAFETRRIFEAVPQLGGQITVTGGGSRNLPLLQAKSDITGVTFSLSPLPELVCAGAALYGMLLLGHQPEFRHAQTKCIEPSGSTAAYDDAYKRYLRLCAAIKE